MRVLTGCALVTCAAGCSTNATPQVPGVALSLLRPDKVVFFDNFRHGANPAWGNERGGWRAVHRTYDASAPNNSPLTYTDVTTETSLTNFTVKVKVVDITDGGVWLRSSWNAGYENGVLLVTGGGNTTGGYYDGFYWHVVTNGTPGQPLDRVSVPGLQNKTATIRIVVKNGTYSLFYPSTAKAPITTLSDSTYSAGSAGLYDYSPRDGKSKPRGEQFTDFSISVP